MATEPEPELKLEIAHVLTIDIVAYGTLLIHQQSRVVAQLNQIVRSTPCFQKAEAAGQLHGLPTGDGMALVFLSDQEAPIQCAIEISTQLKHYPEIAVRMGIHSGPINQVVDVNQRLNFAGAGLDTAQRVMDCGDAGHILLSKRVADDLEPYPRWHRHLYDLGLCEVKHGRKLNVFNFYTEEIGNRAIPRRLNPLKPESTLAGPAARPSAHWRWLVPAVVLALLAAFLAVAWLMDAWPWNGKIGEKSIAVLMFENRSNDKANAYFAEGIQDEILTRLSKIKALKVISRTSSAHYQTGTTRLPEIARQLRVAHVLEGSVQAVGDRVRVTVQLIRAADDAHIWAETFDRELTDIFAVESEIAVAVVERMRASLTGQEEQALQTRPTENPEAHRAYLQGLAYTLPSPEAPPNFPAARRYLREAVRLDPKFALAWALLSNADAMGYTSLALEPTPALREEIRDAAETALRLQPDLGEAVWAMGYYRYACLKDYDSAVRLLEQARRMLPNSSRVPEALAYVARRNGTWNLCENYFDEAERLDPRNTTIIIQHALFYVAQRRFSDGLRKLNVALEIHPADRVLPALKAAVAQADGQLARGAELLAPLHFTLEENDSLETAIYQEILERRPGAVVARLSAELTNEFPHSPAARGELRFWLAWAREFGNDQALALETWRAARAELELGAEAQVENYMLLGYLAIAAAKLGDPPAAFAFVERAQAAMPLERDAIAGPAPLETEARVAALLGEQERALDLLEQLLAIPYAGPLATGNIPLTRALLRLDPMFDNLRANPRFQRLVGGASP